MNGENRKYSKVTYMQNNLKPNYSHLKGERYSRYLKPLNLKVYTYGGLVVSFKYIFTKPENSINTSSCCSFLFVHGG